MQVNDTYLLSQVTNSSYKDQVIHYKDFYGVIEVDIETDSICGRVLYIRDIITFKADTVKQAKIEFAKSVDDYLEFCKELNREPQ